MPDRERLSEKLRGSLRSLVTRVLPQDRVIGIGPIGLRRHFRTLTLGSTSALAGESGPGGDEDQRSDGVSSETDVEDPLARRFPTETVRPPVRTVYGAQYRMATLPDPVTPEDLRERAIRDGWCHEIDLGQGVISPGGMRSREQIAREFQLFGLGDLKGTSLLDIGGVDGGYAFRAEAAGAAPVAVLDHYLWATDAARYGEIHRECIAKGVVPPAPHESDAWHPDTLPGRWRFDLARQVLHSGAEAIVLDFMDCDLSDVGQWDVVLYLGVLYHIADPVRALRRVAAVTRHTAIIETEAMVLRGRRLPLWCFFPDGELNNDRSNWWVPNIGALMGLVGAAGFRKAEVLAGEPDLRALAGEGPHYYRAIIRATK
jgi:tRNA (mo5U34)-methyltransferase